MAQDGHSNVGGGGFNFFVAWIFPARWSGRISGVTDSMGTVVGASMNYFNSPVHAFLGVLCIARWVSATPLLVDSTEVVRTHRTYVYYGMLGKGVFFVLLFCFTFFFRSKIFVVF